MGADLPGVAPLLGAVVVITLGKRVIGVVKGTPLERGAKSFRSWMPANWVLTGIGKSIFRDHPPEFLMSHLARHGEVEVQLPNGASIRLWSRGDDWITSRLWWEGLAGYEPEMVTPFLRFAESARTVLDVGAFVGFYALVAARSNPDARIFAFEPNPDLAARVGRNVTLNKGLRVTTIPYAVADGRGPVSFLLGGDWLPSSSGISLNIVPATGTLPTATLDIDSFAEEWGLEGTVDLIKVDVEGAEPEVLNGMPTTLRRDRPVIFCEVLPGADVDRLEAPLAGLNYRFYHLTPSGADLEPRLQAHPGLFNHLLCPEEKVPPWLP